MATHHDPAVTAAADQLGAALVASLRRSLGKGLTDLLTRTGDTGPWLLHPDGTIELFDSAAFASALAPRTAAPDVHPDEDRPAGVQPDTFPVKLAALNAVAVTLHAEYGFVPLTVRYAAALAACEMVQNWEDGQWPTTD